MNSLHLMLTYQCNFECDHCFAWGSPWQSGTMTLATVRHILQQAQQLGTINTIYFEGGEVFLFYSILLKAVQESVDRGFKVGIVSNSYWATSLEDALEWLTPLAGKISSLELSNDTYHQNSQGVEYAVAAAQQLNMPVITISIALPEATETDAAYGQLPKGESAVMYRGRAAEKLAPRAVGQHWETLNECPYENLRHPGRVHVDPFGNVHLCQGISLGNMLATPLADILANYDPDQHPIVQPLVAGGPAELVRRYVVPRLENYADACHLCFETRQALRQQFPDVLVPDQMYGVNI